MTLNAQTQPDTSHILAAALQADTVEAGLNLIYDAVIAWAWQVPPERLLAYNEARLDQQRSPEARLLVPSRDYLRLWSEARLRAGPVHALNQRLTETEYQRQPDPPPAGLTGADIAAYAQLLAGSLTVEQALDEFEALLVRYASLVSPDKVRQAAAPNPRIPVASADDCFRAVLTLLYALIIDPISAHGLVDRSG